MAPLLFVYLVLPGKNLVWDQYTIPGLKSLFLLWFISAFGSATTNYHGRMGHPPFVEQSGDYIPFQWSKDAPHTAAKPHPRQLCFFFWSAWAAKNVCVTRTPHVLKTYRAFTSTTCDVGAGKRCVPGIFNYKQIFYRLRDGILEKSSLHYWSLLIIYLP